MYRLKVTSYWYLFRCSHCRNGAGVMNMAGIITRERSRSVRVVGVKKGTSSLVMAVMVTEVRGSVARYLCQIE
jgi:hypothetical protein